jgi:hypothetical protein
MKPRPTCLVRLVAAALVVCVGLSSVEVLWADAPAPAERSAAVLYAGDSAGAPSVVASPDHTAPADTDDCPCLCACHCPGAQLVVGPAPAAEEPPAPARAFSVPAPQPAPTSATPHRHLRPPLA